jgi:isoquinoline 1-oxidoreductase beta subunit
MADAAKVTPPDRARPEGSQDLHPDRHRPGAPQGRLIKSDGTARYTQDVHLPDMLTAVVAHAPRFGGKVKSFNAAEAKKVAGVVDVYEIPTGVAVVAQTTYAARMGREALKVEWDEDKVEKRGSAAIAQQFRDIAAGKGPPTSSGKRSTPRATRRVNGRQGREGVRDHLRIPLSGPRHHGADELRGDGRRQQGQADHGSQGQTLDQLAAAKIVGTLPGSVEIETLFAGGSFGRRANFQSDYVAECVHIAKKVGKGRPVKLVWTREDDMRAGYFRPLVHPRREDHLDKDGYPAAWRHRIVSQSIMKGSPMGGKGPTRPRSRARPARPI